VGIRALVFDFDGLLVDTETPELQVWQDLFQEHRQTVDHARWARNIGRRTSDYDPFDHLEALTGRRLDREQLLAEHKRRHAVIMESQGLLPGVEQMLGDARRLGLKTGIASSASRRWILKHLDRLGATHQFDCIKTIDDVREGKPHPQVYQEALRHLGVDGHEAIAFEDSENGARAAKAAGLLCVAVPNIATREMTFPMADLRLTSLADCSLEELLGRLGREAG